MPSQNVATPPGGLLTHALAFILLGLILIVGGTALWLGLQAPLDPLGASDLAFALALLAFPAVGWLLALRRPANPMGWLFLVFPLIVIVGAAFEEVALQLVDANPSISAGLLIGGAWLAFLGYWLMFGPGITLFPDGRPFSGLFRLLLLGQAFLLLLWGGLVAIGPELICVQRFTGTVGDCARSLPNPLHVSVAADLVRTGNVLFIGIFLLTLGTSFTAIIFRYRRSTLQVRQQIKWIAWISVLALFLALGITIVDNILGFALNEWVEVMAFAAIVISLPAAIGVAILRHNLYDIDRILSRTATYSLVTLVLAAVYVGGVSLIQWLLPVQNALGIVLTTLFVAALFNPLRRRVQQGIDKRFNRARYDARRLLESVSAELRDAVELNQMQATLLEAAQEAMEPTHLSLWVRELEIK